MKFSHLEGEAVGARGEHGGSEYRRNRVIGNDALQARAGDEGALVDAAYSVGQGQHTEVAAVGKGGQADFCERKGKLDVRQVTAHEESIVVDALHRGGHLIDAMALAGAANQLVHAFVEKHAVNTCEIVVALGHLDGGECGAATEIGHAKTLERGGETY